jgi:hypothetical protein
MHFSPTFCHCIPSFSTVSDYGLDGRGSIPDRAEDFSSNLCIQTGSGAHPASYIMGTGGSFPGGKERPGRDADHSPPSSADVKKGWELYLLSPKCASMACSGTTKIIFILSVFLILYVIFRSIGK